jgi:hypothetical protein
LGGQLALGTLGVGPGGEAADADRVHRRAVLGFVLDDAGRDEFSIRWSKDGEDQATEILWADPRAGPLLEVLLDAWREGLIGEQYVRGALRIDIPAWEDLRQNLGFPAERTWQSLAAAM